MLIFVYCLLLIIVCFFFRKYIFIIALIRLPTRVRFSQSIQPVRLPTTCKTPVNVVAFAMGFGKTGDYGSVSSRLQYAALRIMPADICRRVYPGMYWSEVIICAHDEINYQGVCQGDSGKFE